MGGASSMVAPWLGSWVWGGMLPWPGFISCVTLNERHGLSEPQLPYLQNGHDASTVFTEHQVGKGEPHLWA